MKEQWTSILPDSLLSQGQFLGGVGIKKTAWPVRCAIDVADHLRVNGWAILGGDLYRRNGSTFTPALENWSCEIAASEAWASFVGRSGVAARRFLSRFNESDSWATIVASSKPDAPQLASSHVR
jgi:hypothetical protein